jgi:hypothetical protein
MSACRVRKQPRQTDAGQNEAAASDATAGRDNAEKPKQQKVKIRKNSLTENLYLDRQGRWVPWKRATWFGSAEAAERFACRHGIKVFGLFPCESFGQPEESPAGM